MNCEDKKNKYEFGDRRINNKRKCAILLKQLHNAMHKNFNKDLESLNLTAVQGEVLIYLFHNQDKKIYQRNIEENLKISNPTATGILQRMEEKELLSRIPDEKDARFKIITLSQNAMGIKEELAKKRDIAAQRLFIHLKDNEIEEFERILNIMVKNMGEEEVKFKKEEM